MQHVLLTSCRVDHGTEYAWHSDFLNWLLTFQLYVYKEILGKKKWQPVFINSQSQLPPVVPLTKPYCLRFKKAGSVSLGIHKQSSKSWRSLTVLFEVVSSVYMVQFFSYWCYWFFIFIFWIFGCIIFINKKWEMGIRTPSPPHKVNGAISLSYKALGSHESYLILWFGFWFFVSALLKFWLPYMFLCFFGHEVMQELTF